MNHLYHYFYRFLLGVMAIASPGLLYAQDSTVRGTITEESTGEPIPGVNILVQGTTTGTVSDINGTYQLSAPQDANLVFSSVGFASETIPVNGRTVIDLSLVQDIQSLSEVVVVGYGTQERARVTGAISSVSSEEIGSQPVISADQALQGRAAGVTVANTGSPGRNPIVRVRGIGTANNNDPLYVIDGMPAGGLNEINPNDIESMQVLKDASAAAIYGSRAANGVIMVTTKKGQKGKTNVNFDAYYGVQNAWKKLDLLNRDQFLQYGREMMTPEGNVPPRFDQMNDPIYEGATQTFAQTDTDWQDEMFRQASIQDYNLSVSGGGENSVFRISGGYFKQEGIMLGTGFERYSFRANSEFSVGKRVKIGQTFMGAYSTRQNEALIGGRSQIEHMIKSAPYIPVYNPNNIGGFAGPGALDGGIDPANPVAIASIVRNQDETMKLLGTAYASAELFDGLTYRIQLGLDMAFGYNDQFTPIFQTEGLNDQSFTSVNQNRTDFISPLISNQLTYDQTFGQHSINAIAVIEQQTHTSRNTGANGRTELTGALDVLNGLEQPAVRGTRDEYALISYIGRVNYDYAGKYLLAASIRRDGGSRFGQDYKWGTFPSVSVGWRLSEESFLSGVDGISELKLRGSWGQVGNDAIGNYRYQGTMDNRYFYHFGRGVSPSPAAGYTTSGLPNPYVKWETTVMTNIGLDVGLFNNQFRASIEYFNNETQDMLLQVPLAPSIGYDGPPTANVGNVENKGWELTAGYYQHENEFQWSLSGNISFVKNELTSLGGGNPLTGAEFEGSRTTFTDEGHPIAYFQGWVVDGIFQTNDEAINAPRQVLPDDLSEYDPQKHTAAGDIKFKDLNGDNVINDADRTNIGHFLPDFTYGVNASANYKNFDLTLFFQGSQGNEILNTNLYDLEGMTRVFNSGTAVLNRWTPENKSTTMPRANFGDENRNARVSDRFIEDGSYLRLKNLTIGYTIPSSVLQRIGNGFISNIRAYVTAQNLLTITDYSGYDPEIGARDGFNSTLDAGVDYGQYPQARTFLVGVQFGF